MNSTFEQYKMQGALVEAFIGNYEKVGHTPYILPSLYILPHCYLLTFLSQPNSRHVHT